MLKKLLKHPLTLHLDLDDPKTTFVRKRIIRQKPFLRRIYQEWYEWMADLLPKGEGLVLELGSGAGFLDEYIPEAITSEVFFCPFVRAIIDGCSMPFAAGSLKAIVMVDVFHHIPDVKAFLQEAVRCLRPGGRILMVEPWITPWSKAVYKHLHHEPMDTEVKRWEFPKTGPLSGANSALPWIVFERDREAFSSEFPFLKIGNIGVGQPFTYLLSGGLSYRSLMPGFSYGAWRSFEAMLDPLSHKIGMFARIELLRV